MNIAISSCLLGNKVRYDGKVKDYPELLELLKGHNLFPICPETMGGLPTPRTPSERNKDKVINKDGIDVTSNYINGALKSLKIIEDNNCELVILKEKSPSCGLNYIYDGSFTKTLINGNGVLYGYLKNKSVPCLNETQLDEIKKMVL